MHRSGLVAFSARLIYLLLQYANQVWPCVSKPANDASFRPIASQLTSTSGAHIWGNVICVTSKSAALVPLQY